MFRKRVDFDLAERGDLAFKPKKHMTRWYEPLAMFRLLLRIWATRRMDDQRAQDHHVGDHPHSPTDDSGSDDSQDDHPGPVDAQSGRVFDYAQTDDDFWFDYVADLGDAFDPTMCVAWHLGRTTLHRGDIDPRSNHDPEFGMPDGLPAPPADDIPVELRRGQLLIMGGDQVYPNGSRTRYRNQTLGPYGLAWEQSADNSDHPEQRESGLLALPANHDWYGGIGPFREAFCSQEKIGGWRTSQHCTWWSARLAHDWWIWGIDTGLDGTINQSQYEYFRRARDLLPPEARLIVCTPVPQWRLRERYVDRLDNLARFFFGLGIEPEVYLSGDYHISAIHRRDRTDGETEWHLTAGGGGAFQHPVHNLDRSIPSAYGGLPTPKIADDEPFQLIATWPSNAESREGTGGWWDLLFDRAAGSLIATLAALQLAVMALVGADHRSPSENLRSVADTIVDHLMPFGAIAGVAVILLATFVLAQATSNARGAMSWARSVGFAHGVIQALVFSAAQLGGNLLLRRFADGDPPDALDASFDLGDFAQTWLVLIAVAAVAAVGVIIVLGLYLRFANRQFRMHDNESYSARHSGDNRHFARFRISPDGSLSCYVIAFRRTGGGWFETLTGTGDGLPVSASDPELIDVRFRTRARDRSSSGDELTQTKIP